MVTSFFQSAGRTFWMKISWRLYVTLWPTVRATLLLSSSMDLLALARPSPSLKPPWYCWGKTLTPGSSYVRTVTGEVFISWFSNTSFPFHHNHLFGFVKNLGLVYNEVYGYFFSSAADLYITKHFDAFARKNARVEMLRLYFIERRISTVPSEVKKYCLLSRDSQNFMAPSREHILQKNVSHYENW